MEFIIGTVVVAVIAYFVFFRKKAEVEVVAPYKVEAVVVEEVKPTVKKAKSTVKKATTRKPKAK
jgi:hypothetical protein